MQLGKDWDAVVSKSVHLGSGERKSFRWRRDNQEAMKEGRVGGGCEMMQQEV